MCPRKIPSPPQVDFDSGRVPGTLGADMKCPRPLLLLVILLLTPLAHAQQQQPGPSTWTHEKSDLKPDDSVKWGQLENGLRYAILPHREPPNRVSLRLYVDAGSLMEEDDQQGLAHFLEHMAFNGTKNYPAGEMVEYFQRLGMAFGSHTNAHTSFKETVYKLELPDAEEKMLTDGFKLLRDYADGLLFGKEEIEKERGVILSEKRSRDSAEWRSFVDWIKFALPVNRIGDRLPIGTEEVISNAPRQRFLDFYNKWYTANRMAVVVVGDVDPANIEKYIKSHLSGLKPPVKPAPDPKLGGVKDRGVVAHHHHDDEASETSVSIEVTKPYNLGVDSEKRRAYEMRMRVASSIISRRLEILSKEEGSPIIKGSTHRSNLFDLNNVEYASIDATTKPENWQKGLSLIDQELRRALQHGFTEAEMTEAKAKLLNQAEIQAKTAATRKSSQLANIIVSTIGSDRVFTDPVEDLPRVQKTLDAITTDQVLSDLRNLWGDLSNVAVYASGKVKIDGAEETILAAYQDSLKIAVEPPAQAEAAEFAYGKEEKPGEIASREYIEDLEITQIKYLNNVRANFKVTDYEDETVRVTIRFGGGQLTEPKDRPGLATLAGSSFSAGGLEAHSADELQRILAGKPVGARFGIGDDAFILAGSTTPENMNLQLQLMRAYLTNPGFRPEGERQFKKSLDEIYQRLYHTPNGIMGDKVSRLIHSGDNRFGFPDRETMTKRSLKEVETWLKPALKNSYLEISIVGDFELDKAIVAVSKTFGSLPKRNDKKPPYESERMVAFPTDIDSKKFEFESQIPKSMALVYWPTADMSDIKRTRRLGLLSGIFRDRLRIKVREELGDAYSPYARNVSSESYTDYGYLFSIVEAAPDQAEKLANVIKEIGTDLSQKGITQDELERAKLPMLTMIEEYRRTNGYWMESVLSMSQEYPQRLDWARSFVDDYKAISKEEIDELAKSYLGPDNALKVLIVPKLAAE